jgi:hypothetical protein
MKMKNIATAVVAAAGIASAVPAVASPVTVSATSIAFDEFGTPTVNGSAINALIPDAALAPERLASNNCNCGPSV